MAAVFARLSLAGDTLHDKVLPLLFHVSARDLQTAPSMKKISKSVLDLKQRDLGKYAMRVFCWSKDGESFQRTTKETGSMLWMQELDQE